MIWCRNNEIIVETINCWYVFQLSDFVYFSDKLSCCIIFNKRVALLYFTSCVKFTLTLLLIHMSQINNSFCFNWVFRYFSRMKKLWYFYFFSKRRCLIIAIPITKTIQKAVIWTKKNVLTIADLSSLSADSRIVNIVWKYHNWYEDCTIILIIKKKSSYEVLRVKIN